LVRPSLFNNSNIAKRINAKAQGGKGAKVVA